MSGKPNVYSIGRNNIPAALRFIEEHWGQLRPEDFTILRQLQDHGLEYMTKLKALKQRLEPIKGSPLRVPLRSGG